MSMTEREAIADELRAERARRRVTVQELAEMIGMHKTTLLNYLNGKRDIPMSVFLRICDGLGISASEMADRIEASLKHSRGGQP